MGGGMDLFHFGCSASLIPTMRKRTCSHALRNGRAQGKVRPPQPTASRPHFVPTTPQTDRSQVAAGRSKLHASPRPKKRGEGGGEEATLGLLHNFRTARWRPVVRRQVDFSRGPAQRPRERPSPRPWRQTSRLEARRRGQATLKWLTPVRLPPAVGDGSVGGRALALPPKSWHNVRPSAAQRELHKSNVRFGELCEKWGTSIRLLHQYRMLCEVR